LRKPWSISMNTCETNSLSGISIYLRGEFLEWHIDLLKKGPLTTTGDLSACKSIWSLIWIYTINKVSPWPWSPPSWTSSQCPWST
jgi:hypothetical protein